jgi:hypothetical protein
MGKGGNKRATHKEGRCNLFQKFFTKTEEKKDVLQVVIADTHSGSNYALFLNREWHGIKTSHIPRAKQLQIRKQFEEYAEEVRHARIGKQVKLVMNGDAIDGDHHRSGDVCTLNEKEQADIHIELMIEFQRRIDWQAGDELYYTKGTQTHVHEQEYYIGRELNAIPDGDFYAWNILKLESNSVVSWFVHHGPSRGKGWNEGNAMRNWLKTIYVEAIKDGTSIPDIVYTGHVHDPTFAAYEWRNKMVFKMMYGVILPSWQTKTDYGYQVAAVEKNKIGGVYHEIKADGTICIPKFSVMETQ